MGNATRLVDLALLSAAQLAVGGLTVGLAAVALPRVGRPGRRRFVRRAETTRLACRTAAAAAPVAVLLGLAQQAAPRDWPGLRCPGGPWVPLVLGGLCACATVLLLAAGMSEAAGRRRRAARRADTAGRLMFLACATYAAFLFAATVLATAGTRRATLPGPWSPALLALAAITLGLAGFVGLLAGLSRKPRPSGTFATLLYLLSQWALLAALTT